MHLFLQLLQRGPLLIPSLPPASDLSLGSLPELLRPAPLDEACWVGTCVALFPCRLRHGDLYGLSRPGLCVSGPVALVSPPWARPLRLVAYGTCFLSPPALFLAELMCLSSRCAARVVCAAQVCTPPLSLHPGPALCTRVVRAPGVCVLHLTQLPGPALCVEGVVCAGYVCIPLRGILSIPEPTVWLGPQSVSC